MHIPKPLIKLPLSFEAERLAEEIIQFGKLKWQTGSTANGNATLLLFSAESRESSMPDGLLSKTPYIRQLLASFEAVISRVYLTRVAPGGRALPQPDSRYLWRNHLRIILPINTAPDTTFYCGAERAQMAAGESWVFDPWLQHGYQNNLNGAQLYLLIDALGSSALWQMMDGRDTDQRLIEFDDRFMADLRLEQFTGLPVMPASELAAELRHLIAGIATGEASDQRRKQRLQTRIDEFILDWRSQWAITGPYQQGLHDFQELLTAFKQDIDELGDGVLLEGNGLSFRDLARLVLDAALTPDKLLTADKGKNIAANTGNIRPQFDRPVFIVAAPRSGSTLLFESLAVNRAFWSLGDESHRQFEGIVALRPSGANPSNRLTAEMATEEVRKALISSLASDLVDAAGKPFMATDVSARPRAIRFLEKTPKNALRIPFILKVFPDARFIFLYRDARQNLSSLLETWRSRKWVTYPKLPDWPTDKPWSHLLIPGWQALRHSSLAEIVARQWLVTNQTILDDLQQLPAARWCTIDYDSLLADTDQELRRLCHFSEVIYGPRLAQLASQPLKYSKYTLSAPRKDKWQINEAELTPVLASTEALMTELRSLKGS
ncbi:MAG: hypothetical protein HKN85_11365 [Gammaproteobacteria bacterium]|nr:hypothetical protein [Gammaproteobacteria bacterium]